MSCSPGHLVAPDFDELIVLLSNDHQDIVVTCGVFNSFSCFFLPQFVGVVRCSDRSG